MLRRSSADELRLFCTQLQNQNQETSGTDRCESESGSVQSAESRSRFALLSEELLQSFESDLLQLKTDSEPRTSTSMSVGRVTLVEHVERPPVACSCERSPLHELGSFFYFYIAAHYWLKIVLVFTGNFSLQLIFQFLFMRKCSCWMRLCEWASGEPAKGECRFCAGESADRAAPSGSRTDPQSLYSLHHFDSGISRFRRNIWIKRNEFYGYFLVVSLNYFLVKMVIILFCFPLVVCKGFYSAQFIWPWNWKI